MYHRRILQQQIQQQQNDDVKRSGNDVSPSLLITVLILAIAVILSASLYLLLRFLRRNTTSTPAPAVTRTRSAVSALPNHYSRRVSPLVDALPLFTSDSLKSSGGGDCAVCLSKFEKQDLLRLLPICCHVFHADCIDTWLNSNQSCPLCRSPVFLPDSELFSKLGHHHHHPTTNDVTPSSPSSLSSSSRSFRVEIGSVSRRNNNPSGELPVHRTYSLGGNFDYVVEDDAVSEVNSGSFRRTSSSTSEFKLDHSDTHQQQQHLESEVGTRGGGGGWLKDYLTHSLSSSFRSSGRWFYTGSSRRESNAPTTTTTSELGIMSDLDLESSRLGDEIGELFRWLSGV